MTKQHKGSACATAETQNAEKTGRHRERHSIVIHIKIDLDIVNIEYLDTSQVMFMIDTILPEYESSAIIIIRRE